MFDAISEGKEASVAYFNNWVEEVKRTVPKEKLLIFSVKEGWGPLCKFLDAPIPEVPFPNTNDSAQMKKYVKLNQIKAYSFVVGAPILHGICTYFFVKKGKLTIITNMFSNFLSMITKKSILTKKNGCFSFHFSFSKYVSKGAHHIAGMTEMCGA